MKKTILALLTALCLPLAGVVVRAQSLQQSSDTLRHCPSHSIGFDLRPSYVFPTSSFLEVTMRWANPSTRPFRLI